jgi:hypothetical protein
MKMNRHCADHKNTTKNGRKKGKKIKTKKRKAW